MNAVRDTGILRYRNLHDCDLLAASCDGDIEAFGNLFERYHARLLNYAEMLSGGRVDAEAVVQEAFLRAFSARGGFRGEANVATWLFTIARNETYRELKRNRKPLFVPEDAVCAEEPEEIVLRKERVRMIVRAMNKLPLIQREAIVLTRYGGLTCADAARVLNKSESSIQNAVFRGLQNLRKRMAGDE